MPFSDDAWASKISSATMVLGASLLVSIACGGDDEAGVATSVSTDTFSHPAITAGTVGVDGTGSGTAASTGYGTYGTTGYSSSDYGTYGTYYTSGYDTGCGSCEGTTTGGETTSGGWGTETTADTEGPGQPPDVGGGPPDKDFVLPPAEPFGDDVVEQELVGRWSLFHHAGASWNQVLEISENGSFAWHEFGADCSGWTTNRGKVFVQTTSLVFNVEEAARLPWDADAAGTSRGRPYRMALSYTLHAGGLSLSGPPGLTGRGPYRGRAYIRESSVGNRLGGTYVSYARLEGFPASRDGYETLLVDKWTAQLDHADSSLASGAGAVAIARQTYIPDTRTTTTYEPANWVDQRTDPTARWGTAVLNGAENYQFGDSYYGTFQLSTDASGLSFKKNLANGCTGQPPPPPPGP